MCRITAKTILFGLLLPCALVSCTTKEIVNPVIQGWYADPEGAVFGDEFWIYPTLSLLWGDDTLRYASDLQRTTPAWNQEYNLQTHIDAFSSKDLVHWKKHPAVLSVAQVPWVSYAMWAPAIVHANNRYYLFFSGNDIQSDEQVGGIGVAVSDKPGGPFEDALGHPLVGKIVNGAQPIDQFVFHDDDGNWYMYYGGWRHCNMIRLSDDLVRQIPFDDGEMFKEVTPQDYVEGPFMLKREGKYYFMWSEGGWTGPDYRVAYAIADSPFGPFKREGTILQQDSAIATGAGHHSVIQHPKTGDYYIVYHRRPLGHTGASERQVCIDRLLFDSSGKILPVKMTGGGASE